MKNPKPIFGPRVHRRLSSWSFSTHQGLRRCPAKVKYAKIDKLEDPIGRAGDRGTVVHSAFESYAQGELACLPAGFERWKPALDHLLQEADDVQVEMELAFTKRWYPTTWEKGIIRAKLDLVAVTGEDLTCIDYKTGMIYPEHEEQLELYALMLLRVYSWADRVHAADWYLDQNGAVAEKVYERAAYDALLEKWRERARKDLRRKEFPARRNAFCKTCNFSSKRGGPCTEGA